MSRLGYLIPSTQLLSDIFRITVQKQFYCCHIDLLAYPQISVSIDAKSCRNSTKVIQTQYIYLSLLFCMSLWNTAKPYQTTYINRCVIGGLGLGTKSSQYCIDTVSSLCLFSPSKSIFSTPPLCLHLPHDSYPQQCYTDHVNHTTQ